MTRPGLTGQPITGLPITGQPMTGPLLSGPARIDVSLLSVTHPDVYEGRGSSVALHRVVDVNGRAGLYKEYKAGVAATMDADLLTELVRWPASLSQADRDRMLPHLAHPWAVVMQHDRAAGVLMPEAAESFFYRDRRGKLRPRTIDTLSTPRNMARKNNSPYFEPPHRLALLGRLLMLVSELHASGVVIGDLQPQNILVCADPMDPAVMVLDCDSFWLHGRHAFGAPTDPETWRSPWMGGAFTTQTDLFKLALLVTRCLQEDNRDWYPRREVLSEFMPSHQVDRLEGLMAMDVTVSAQQLRGLAGNWRSRVGNNGTFYNSTDAFLHAPWTPPPASDAPVPPPPPPSLAPASGATAPPWGTPSGAGRPGVTRDQVTGPMSAVPTPAAATSPAHATGAAATTSNPRARRPARLGHRIFAWAVLTALVASAVFATIYGQ